MVFAVMQHFTKCQVILHTQLQSDSPTLYTVLIMLLLLLPIFLGLQHTTCQSLVPHWEHLECEVNDA